MNTKRFHHSTRQGVVMVVVAEVVVVIVAGTSTIQPSILPLSIMEHNNSFFCS